MTISDRGRRYQIIAQVQAFLARLPDAADGEVIRLTVDLVADLARLACGRVP